MKRLLLALLFAAALAPVAARAQNLYINLTNLRVEEKKLANGCHLSLRPAFPGDKVVCTDPDGAISYHWHTILLQKMTGPLQLGCELRVVKENHKAFQYRWHAVIYPGSAYCRMHWANDNTLDVEPGVR
jgi:hypothetical protein